MEAVRP